MKRSSLLAATAAFALSGTRHARAAEPMRIAISASEESSILFMASERGMFKEAGLDATATIVAPNQMVQGVLGGSFDLGVSNTGAILLAHMHALPLYLVAPASVYTTRQPISRIAVTLGSPI